MSLKNPHGSGLSLVEIPNNIGSGIIRYEEIWRENYFLFKELTYMKKFPSQPWNGTTSILDRLSASRNGRFVLDKWKLQIGTWKFHIYIYM